MSNIWNDDTAALLLREMEKEQTMESLHCTPTQLAIAKQCQDIRELLLAKNRAYGDSAISPLNVMASDDAIGLIAARCDDKLSRIKNAGGLKAALKDYAVEDTVQDLIGYLILAKVALICGPRDGDEP